ncbi:hypothetical protein BG015_011071 [Linnemannia schmuckeri]|uniref:Uncharacterized protein n=1 Tax=Linnemannia schmuckeri TaxID=64567 RepID=A0A9P5S4Q8_9FUNG|nr:hypothetical protein BG015_011071 [Linnemannia schmuckeri]
MGSKLDNFDTLCQQVFLPSKSADDEGSAHPSVTTSVQETALSLLSRAQIYEVQTPLTSTSTTPESAQNDRQYYRIHLEELEDRHQQQKVRDILIQAIDPSLLVILPYDRNLSGYSSKTRTEATEAPLETAVVLDMGGLSSPEPSAGSVPTTVSSTTNSKPDKTDPAASTDIDDTVSKTMLLVSVKEWLRLTGRIRFWRAESHRIKTAQREVVLDGLLEERWRTATSSATPSTPISSPPHSSGSLTAAALTPQSLPSSTVSSPSTASSVPASPCASAVPPTLTKLSTYKQPFQEHQLESLVQFMTAYGDEPSATSILRGLLDLARRQLTDTTVLSWTFDRANLTEQKPEVTVAFLDLIARLGLELVNPSAFETGKQQQQQDAIKPSAAIPTTSYSSVASDATAVGTPKATTPVQSTDLTWTFGTRIDDRRLEYWIHHLQQSTLPVARVDHQSLLPSTASFAPTSSNNNATAISSGSSGPEQKPNLIPQAIRKRFLQDRQTIPAGTIQPLTNIDTNPHSNAKSNNTITRDPTFVLATSRYALSSSSSSISQGTGLFVNVKKDVKDLARWTSTCGGRLDWIWAWLFSSFQRSRHEAKSASRKPRPNDENV